MMKVLLMFLMLVFSSRAQGKDLQILNSKVEFNAEASPGFLKIHGTGGKIEAKATMDGGLVSGEFKVKVADFTTDLALRDDHLKNKYMEVDKYPEMILVIKDHPVSAKKFTGMLTFHGQTKPVNGEIKVEGNLIKAQFPVNVIEFGVAKPSHLGVGMHDSLTAMVEFEYR